MLAGIVFDLREFTVHDGPGLRTTVFMKGCPLRCAWCHNPEALSPCPEVVRSASGERLVGKAYTPDSLASILNRQSSILSRAGGGVTFSGGEPLLQADFVSEVIDRLNGIHVTLDTSGHAPTQKFQLVAEKCDLVYFDLKLINPEMHLRFTGVDNSLIHRNLESLSEIGVPFVIRIPLIPGVTDSDENLQSSAEFVAGRKGLLQVDLLPYNRAAGGKYSLLGKTFSPTYDENRRLNVDLAPFERLNIPVHFAGPVDQL
jgi:pyruvate formate lyase activating enzyme